MNDLAIAKLNHPDDVEICISDNFSDDDTLRIVQNYSSKFSFVFHRQSKNIGAALNFKSVCNIATGKWILCIGDDDRLVVENLFNLICDLKETDINTWVLVDTVAPSGIHQFANFRRGNYTNLQATLLLLKRNVNCFGFLGSHLIPFEYLKFLNKLGPADILGWPHLFLFLSIIPHSSIFISPLTLVRQAPLGGNLFWTKSEWCKINFIKFRLILSSRSLTLFSYSFLYVILALRFLYSFDFLAQFISWKLYEPSDFFRHSLRFQPPVGVKYVSMLFIAPLSLFYLILKFLPRSFLLRIFLLFGITFNLNDYKNLKVKSATFESSRRGY